MTAMLRTGPDAELLINLRVVPGASRSAIAGRLGERLKVRVSAPPEDGKANRAVCALIAEALGVKARQVAVASGASSPEKTLRITGFSGSIADAEAALLSTG